MKKGMSPFISTAFVVLFGIILISTVMFTLGQVQSQGIERTVNDQLVVVSREMGTEVLDVYNSVKGYQKSLENNSAVLVREVDVSLPQTIGSRNYKIMLEEPQDILLSVVQFYIDGVAVNSTSIRPTARLISESEDVTVENKLYNIDTGLQGYSKGGETKIRGYKYNINGTTRDKIILGNDKVIISVQNFSVSDDSGCSSNKRLSISGSNIYTSGAIPGTMNFKATIIETQEFNVTSSSNPFTLIICTSAEDQKEYTVIMETWDANDNRGTIRKKFLG